MLKPAGVVVPVETQQNGGWGLAGIVCVEPSEVGFRDVPRSGRGRKQLAGRAVRRGKRAIGRAA